MLGRSLTVCSVAALLLGGTAAAQSRGTLLVGGFGQWTWFDENAGRANAVPKDGFGYGGRVGVFLSDIRTGSSKAMATIRRRTGTSAARFAALVRGRLKSTLRRSRFA